MKRHILIHGDHVYLRLLFVHNLLKNKKFERINGKDPNTLDGSFRMKVQAERKEILCFQNVNVSIDPRDFIALTGICYEHKTDNNLELATPTLIIEYSGKISVPEGQTFLRRFYTINVDTLRDSEVIDFLANGLRTAKEG
ncbi:hypothetical protein CMT52_13115 [Elizabethkingia anophelis]|nr:hypothetical protein [Elizabethkingia anophelis]